LNKIKQSLQNLLFQVLAPNLGQKVKDASFSKLFFMLVTVLEIYKRIALNLEQIHNNKIDDNLCIFIFQKLKWLLKSKVNHYYTSHFKKSLKFTPNFPSVNVAILIVSLLNVLELTVDEKNL